jgi:L-fuculose-phosphate aldolase
MAYAGAGGRQHGSVGMIEQFRDLVDQLVDAGRDAARRGLVIASAGNLSARRPGGDEFVVTAAGTWFDRLAAWGQFSLVGLDGTVRDGHARPSTEWKLHARTYQLRPDVTCVIHLHPQTAVLVDALGHDVRLVNLDHVVYLGRVARVPFLPNGSDELAEAAAEASRDSNAVILAHHGCSTLGDTVEMAYRRALNLEEAAENTFRCLQLGNVDLTFPQEWLPAVRGGS